MKLSKLWFLFFIAGCAAILVSGASRFQNPESNDFEAFYEASNHFLNMETPYLSWVERPYKYPPVATILISPLALMEGSVARRLLLALDILATFFNIFLCWRLFQGTWRPRTREMWMHFSRANCFAILCSLRFLDNEFHSKNLNQISYTLILLGLFLVRKFRYPLWGLLLSGWGSFIKLTPLMAFWTYVGLPLKQHLSKVVLALLLLMFLPWPTMWIDWIQQMRTTTGAFPLDDTLFFQGFFPFVAHFLNVSSRSSTTLLFALPLIVYTLWKLPRFDVNTLSACSSASWKDFLIAQFLLILFSLTLNPLPWQHLYGFLLIFVASACYARQHGPGPLTIAACLILGLSSRGIAGETISVLFEKHQGIFLCVLIIFWENLQELIRRLGKNSSQATV